jgi:hypothetical protein
LRRLYPRPCGRGYCQTPFGLITYGNVIIMKNPPISVVKYAGQHCSRPSTVLAMPDPGEFRRRTTPRPHPSISRTTAPARGLPLKLRWSGQRRHRQEPPPRPSDIPPNQGTHIHLSQLLSPAPRGASPGPGRKPGRGAGHRESHVRGTLDPNSPGLRLQSRWIGIAALSRPGLRTTPHGGMTAYRRRTGVK